MCNYIYIKLCLGTNCVFHFFICVQNVKGHVNTFFKAIHIYCDLLRMLYENITRNQRDNL